MRKPLVDISSIKANHDLQAVNKIIKRPGWEKLVKQQPKTVNKLG